MRENCIKNLETQVEALQAKVAKAQDLQKEQESVQVRLVSVRADLEQDLQETKEELEEVIKKKTDDIESNVNFRLDQLKLDEVIQYKIYAYTNICVHINVNLRVSIPAPHPQN